MKLLSKEFRWGGCNKWAEITTFDSKEKILICSRLLRKFVDVPCRPRPKRLWVGLYDCPGPNHLEVCRTKGEAFWLVDGVEVSLVKATYSLLIHTLQKHRLKILYAKIYVVEE